MLFFQSRNKCRRMPINPVRPPGAGDWPINTMIDDRRRPARPTETDGRPEPAKVATFR
jgi:hypothetical protein